MPSPLFKSTSMSFFSASFSFLNFGLPDLDAVVEVTVCKQHAIIHAH